MKENRLKIIINRPVEEVFKFTTNPANTPLWNNTIVMEEAELPLKVGSKYRNRNKFDDVWEYVVSAFIPNEVFELKSLHSDYEVGYSYRAVDDNTTELGYFEEAPTQDLAQPFTQETLEKLKKIMEAR